MQSRASALNQNFVHKNASHVGRAILPADPLSSGSSRLGRRLCCSCRLLIPVLWGQAFRPAAGLLPGVFAIAAILVLASALDAADPHIWFSVIGPEPGAWPQILTSIGLTRQDTDQARIFVLRSATPASNLWANRVDQGAFVILEGES